MTQHLPYGAQSSAELSGIIRHKRADFKQKLLAADDRAMRRELIATLVWMPPRWAATWRVHDVVKLVPGWSDERAETALYSVNIRDANRTLFSLTTRQAEILAEQIRQAGAKRHA